MFDLAWFFFFFFYTEKERQKIVKIFMKIPSALNKTEATKIKLVFSAEFEILSVLRKVLGDEKLMVSSNMCSFSFLNYILHWAKPFRFVGFVFCGFFIFPMPLYYIFVLPLWIYDTLYKCS